MIHCFDRLFRISADFYAATDVQEKIGIANNTHFSSMITAFYCELGLIHCLVSTHIQNSQLDGDGDAIGSMN